MAEKMIISKLLREIEKHAPLSLALNWDNVGLLIGDRQREVGKVLISLDFTAKTLNKAIERGAELIVTHHPVFLHGTKQVTDPLILRLIENKIALIALHTNLDVAEYSVNHALADALGLQDCQPLTSESGNQRYQVNISVPPDYREAVLQAAFHAGAGRIGNYGECSRSIDMKGSFLPLSHSKPFIGEQDKQSIVDEVYLSFYADKHNLSAILSAIRQAHPYEEPDVNHYPLADTNSLYGLGRIGRLEESLSLKELAEHCKQSLGIPVLRYWTAGKTEQSIVERIAVCGGAGASVIRAAAAKADVLITGDISYHNLLDSSIPLIDAGHFYTEYPALKYLDNLFTEMKLETTVLEMQDHEFECYNKYI